MPFLQPGNLDFCVPGNHFSHFVPFCAILIIYKMALSRINVSRKVLKSPQASKRINAFSVMLEMECKATNDSILHQLSCVYQVPKSSSLLK